MLCDWGLGGGKPGSLVPGHVSKALFKHQVVVVLYLCYHCTILFTGAVVMSGNTKTPDTFYVSHQFALYRGQSLLKPFQTEESKTRRKKMSKSLLQANLTELVCKEFIKAGEHSKDKTVAHEFHLLCYRCR